MSGEDSKQVFDQGLAYFGVITASLSHEKNNVLAMISELAGLQEDCFYAAERGRPLDTDKLRNVAERIADQVERGKQLIKQLNTFAHSIDEPGATLDVGSNLADIVGLCQRFARLRKAGLECHATGDHIATSCRPFDVQHMVYRCLEVALAAVPPGGSITVTEEQHDGQAMVKVTTPEHQLAAGEVEPQLAFIAMLANSLGAAIDTKIEPGQPLVVTLHLPPRAAGSGEGTE